MLKSGNAKGASASKSVQASPEAVAATGDLINQLSNERLTLYRRGVGRPLAREVRIRLSEIVRELDRLWEQRRRELASPPFPIEAAVPSAKARPRGQPQVA